MTAVRKKLIKLKYETQSRLLQNAFVEFINKRHVIGDFNAKEDEGEQINEDEFIAAAARMQDSYENLVESTRFVSRMAQCDGAIVLTCDLTVLGFGAEIKAEASKNIRAFEVMHEIRREHHPLDAEQFGLRHRSAVKLVSRDKSCHVLVIFQDGPISSIWSDDEKTLVRKNLNLANLNMPLA